MNLPDVHITADAIYFDGQKLPGVILEHGITIKPGGLTHANTVTVKFIVGRVISDDPTLYERASS